MSEDGTKDGNRIYYALILIFVGLTLYFLLLPPFFANRQVQQSTPIITSPTNFPSINLTVFYSSKCKAFCDSTAVENALKRLFVSLNIKRVDVETPEGKQLAIYHGISLVPGYLFDPSIKKSPGFEQFKPNLRETDPNYFVLNTLETASGYLFLTEETRDPSLVLFVTSYDPPSLRMLNKTFSVLKRFNNSINFTLHYVVSNENETLSSINGETELVEDAIQLCAVETENKNALKGVLCRTREILGCLNSSDAPAICASFWKLCLQGWGMDADEIEQCVLTRNQTLLERQANVSMASGIGAVPTMFIGNKYRVIGEVDNLDLFSSICAIYPRLEGCVLRVRQ